jgi:hypothetical protein
MRIQNQQGIITVDFLFSFILVGGFAFIIFALSLTLTVAEVVQYVTFSAARNYYAASESEDAQRAAATLKFQSLVRDPAIQPLLTSGWFSVDSLPTVGNIGENFPPLSEIQNSSSYSRESSTFQGVVVYFVSKVLEFNIPFYGSTVSDDLRGGTDFGAFVGSYLGREVTQVECETFLIPRWEKIKRLPTHPAASYSEAANANYYLGFADNGC